MSSTLTKALIAFVPVSLLLAYSVGVLRKQRTTATLVQLLGAALLLVVVLTHVAEALRVFPAMRFGEPDSIGHYIDLSSAVGGVALLVGSLLLRVLAGRSRVTD
jgi:hypothetical protein